MSIEALRYPQGKVTFAGRLARPRDAATPRGGVLVFPTWKGVDAFACAQAERVADLGYVALVADVYGDGRVAATDEEAAAAMRPLAENRGELRRRARAALDALVDQQGVGAGRTAAIGFCFGGMAALELARSQPGLRAVVTFHGFFNTPRPAAPGDVLPAIQAHHGTLDPLVPMDEVLAFQREMDGARADWQVVLHGGALHGFTNPAAAAPERGIAHHPAAARRAWEMTSAFLEEHLHG